ncbi:MAG: hypothetical protein QNJ32_06590 [Xenococcaceae cyanobacterium MO_167.B27]|nr:hypothetical protein [Xenococcaceae cyanobacterium MO_167.B27]
MKTETMFNGFEKSLDLQSSLGWRPYGLNLLNSSTFQGAISEYDAENDAPAGTIEERHGWGQKHLGASYHRGINWLNPYLQEDFALQELLIACLKLSFADS